MGQTRRWRLVSQLSLNHISFTSGEQGAAAFRELLGLYAFQGTPASRSVIEGISHVEAVPAVGRLPGDVTGALCRGMEIRVSFDEAKYTAGNLFLFASVLEHFLSLLSNINSFTRTVGISTKRSGVFHRWPARAGQQMVL
jgi:type VI secretion system protein ImpG